MLFAVTWMDLYVGDKKNKRKANLGKGHKEI